MNKPTKIPFKNRVYMGCTIDREAYNGMYYALTGSGRVMADTLAGIKELIKAKGKGSEIKLHFAKKVK